MKIILIMFIINYNTTQKFRVSRVSFFNTLLLIGSKYFLNI